MDPTLDELKLFYLEQCWGPTKIASKFSISIGRIGYLLVKYGIPRRTNSKAVASYYKIKRQECGSPDPSPKQLRELYVGQKLSAIKIAPLLNCAKDHVYYLLNKYSIPRRQHSHPLLKEGAKNNLPKDIAGEKNPNWKGGVSKEPYPFYFDIDLKEQVRQRDNYTCQVCGMPQDEYFEQYKERLSCHHINYLKDDLRPENLISLCRSCHSKTHYSRPHWQSFFEAKIKQIYS